MNKRIIVTTISILIVIFIFIKFNKDIITGYILTKLSKWTERTVKSDSVEIDFSKGKINFNGLEILNKPNFNDKNIFEAKKNAVVIDFEKDTTDIQPLLDEITQLRNQILDYQEQLIEANKPDIE